MHHRQQKTGRGRGEQHIEHWEEFRWCVCVAVSTCEGSVTLSVTTSSLVYLMNR